jgi:hypothetical protein
MSTDAPPDRVFLSYSSKDKLWADAACAVLESKGVRCWIAPRDIAPGTEWGASIIAGIDSCRVMVLILSEHANQSPQVRREVERAVSKGLVIMPCRVEDVRPVGALEYALSNTHWLDVFSPPMEEQVERLAEAVQAVLAVSHAPGTVPAPTPTRPATVKRNPGWNWIIAGAVAIGLSLFSGLIVAQQAMNTVGGPRGDRFGGGFDDFDKRFDRMQQLAWCGVPINLLFWGGVLSILIGLVLLLRGNRTFG